MDLLNIDAMLSPISPESPTGTDPRADISPTSRYYLLKDIRSQARANERASLVEEDEVQALSHDWLPILDQIPEALQQEAKDLEYVAWLIEALCRHHGFEGLALGFSVARQLIADYWEELFPLPDEEGVETRIAPLIGLNGYDGEGALISPIMSIPITEANGAPAFATWQYSRANEISRLDEDKQRRKFEAGAADLSQIEAAVKSTSPQFYIRLMENIQQAIDEFNLLSSAMDAAMGGSPQPTSMISKSLLTCQDAVQYLAGDKVSEFIAAQSTSQSTSSDMPSSEESALNHKADTIELQLASRDKAVKQLRDVAEYFKKAEPHSPMSYAIEQVVRWSNLSLPELLQELIDDGGSRTHFFRLTGIPVED
jgi:type VI secretion system protein ImpA